MQKISIPKFLFGFILFGLAGFGAEIIFTALYDLVFAVLEGKSPDWSLKGQSYIWMLPIYGLGAPLMKWIYPKIARYAVPFRLAIYVVGIFAIEYITGFLLEQFTGKCPWNYNGRPFAFHYINLAYAPYWAILGFILEVLHQTTMRYEKTDGI